MKIPTSEPPNIAQNGPDCAKVVLPSNTFSWLVSHQANAQNTPAAMNVLYRSADAGFIFSINFIEKMPTRLATRPNMT